MYKLTQQTQKKTKTSILWIYYRSKEEEKALEEIVIERGAG